jgi:hypothetical protein
MTGTATARRRISHAIALLGLAASPLTAQVNIEALRPDDPPVGRSGSLSGDLTVRTGNIDFVQLAFGARHQHVTESLTTLVIGDGGVGLLGGSSFASSGLFHFRQTWRPLVGISPEWYAQTNYDRAQLLRLRLVAGAGGRTSLSRGTWGQLGVGTGLRLEHERLKVPMDAVHPSRTSTVRASSFVTLKIVTGESFVVTSTSYIQPRVSRPGDVRVLENMRIGASVTDRVSLTVAFDLRFDSEPPDGIARLDSTLRTGVTYSY